ncbi:hypothetical protein K32_29950 [Kaistia sp. 32K]|uniref:hypothetical protein n=1 Tax=Kaistia sp. 32K TaxID=2795690 RepID=UPI001916A1C8|nr:hypothetical protein [Kaistia sp. 32K]BCP54378.1 hypothetical protein K32_29950 [Kaistia sp. 32K]
MSELQRIIEMIQETDVAFAEVQRLSLENPNDPSFELNARSLEKRRGDLARRLRNKLYASQTELVTYRISRSWSDSYPAKAVSASVYAFQELVTAIFDAIHNGPKKRFRPSAEVVESSTFEFAGASPGSVIISLAAPDDRLLFGDTQFGLTLNLVEKVLGARDSDALFSIAEEIGVAAIAKVYSWANASEIYGLDTNIKWGGVSSVGRDISISRDDASTIKAIIGSRSEESSRSVHMYGILLGFDGARSYFHFKEFGDNGAEITGGVDSNLSHSWTTGLAYRAEVLRTDRIVYSTGEEKIDWILLSLNSLPDGT